MKARSTRMEPELQLPSGYRMRVATVADLEALTALIALSARTLSAADYSPAQIDGALRGAFGVDTQLIRDQTYFAIERSAELVACGGWSYRRTLFGGDARVDRDAAELDPVHEAAKIRAFFIHPQHARRGLGAALLARCEHEALARGFLRLELMATLPGLRLYAAHGFERGVPVHWPLGDGLTIEFVPMSKRLEVSGLRR